MKEKIIMLNGMKIFFNAICLTVCLVSKADSLSPEAKVSPSNLSKPETSQPKLPELETSQPELPQPFPGFMGQLPKDPFEITWGDASAPLTIVAYTALSCGHCAEFHKTILPEIVKKYIETGQVRFVFRHFPIDRLSLQMATVVNKMPLIKRGNVIDKIFQEQEKLIEELIKAGDKAYEKIAYICGMNPDECHEIWKSREDLDAALKSRLDIEKLTIIEGTPTFFINDKMYPTALSWEQFDQIISAELKALPKASSNISKTS